MNLFDFATSEQRKLIAAMTPEQQDAVYKGLAIEVAEKYSEVLLNGTSSCKPTGIFASALKG